MEDVLDIYQRPYDPKYPVICLDETNKQLVKETKLPVPAEPGQVALFRQLRGCLRSQSSS